MKFNFEQKIDRHGTGCHKWDGGKSGVDLQAPYQFTIADMDLATPPRILDAIKKRTEHPVFGYTHAEAPLTDALIGWMKRRHGTDIPKAWVRPSTGILTGLALALRAVTKPNDKVMVFTPVYNPFFTIIEGAGCELVECPLKKVGTRYEMDYPSAEEHLKNGVKAILFCNPHNPVGRVWSKSELKELIDLCLKYHVNLLSDEAHGDIELFGNQYTPLCSFTEMEELGISCISPNKSFNVPGIGMAFLVIPNTAVYKRTVQLHREYWLMAPAIFCMVAAQAGYEQGDEWMDELLQYLEGNSVMIQDFTKENMPGIKIADHEATYLLWLNISCFGMDADAVMTELAASYGVQLSSGAIFRGDGDSHLRFNIAAPRWELREAIEAMARMYSEHCRGKPTVQKA